VICLKCPQNQPDLFRLRNNVSAFGLEVKTRFCLCPSPFSHVRPRCRRSSHLIGYTVNDRVYCDFDDINNHEEYTASPDLVSSSSTISSSIPINIGKPNIKLNVEITADLHRQSRSWRLRFRASAAQRLHRRHCRVQILSIRPLSSPSGFWFRMYTI
jgi:hypothetical protein